MTTTPGRTLKNAKRLLLIDDHPVVRRGMASAFAGEAGFEICGEAGDATAALDAVRTLEPDLVLMDLSLGDDSGLELIKDFHAIHEALAILVVSVHPDAIYAERVLKAGALGYINKQVGLEQIIVAARTVAAGKIYLSPEMANRMLHQITNGTQDPNELPTDRLSDRELEVYRMLGQGRGTRDIAESLHLSMKTIETYREHIKEKLNLKDSNEMVCHAARWVAEQA